MLAVVRATRSLCPATTSRPFRLIHSTRNNREKDKNNVQAIINLSTGLQGANSSTPPVAGAAGYAPPNPPPPRDDAYPNPFNEKDKLKYLPSRPVYRLYCQSTRNNTTATLMTHEGNILVTYSGGSCGYRKVNRSTYEAGYQCAVQMFQKIQDLKEDVELHLFLNGFGQGRDAMRKALLAAEGAKVRSMIVALTDRTPIKIGGTRAKKARRL